MDPRARHLNRNHSPVRYAPWLSFAASNSPFVRIRHHHRNKQWRIRSRRFERLGLGALTPIMQQSSGDPMSASHRRDIRSWLEALRQNPHPLLVTPAKVSRRTGDYLDAPIAPSPVVIVMMSVIVTVILHGDFRRSDTLSRCYRSPQNLTGEIAVPLTFHLPFVAFLTAVWAAPAQRLPPSPKAAAIFAAMVAVTTVYAFGLSLLTERHTKTFRDYVLRFRGLKSSDSGTAASAR